MSTYIYNTNSAQYQPDSQSSGSNLTAQVFGAGNTGRVIVKTSAEVR
ncbi:MAG: hypothetical protein F6J90_27945 [Moorea sp. SIOASIH]|nr:hypothetical protein [Moorena sp. SIOASIH]NEO39959.1 hypothetical protein [Moorena sp. SIOASIH]NEO96401.1 hypothetical protein [Moorena sp. SIO3G5]